MNYIQTLQLAITDCNHDFSVVDEASRFSPHYCKICKVMATAGEIAWMMAGGTQVHLHHHKELVEQQELQRLAEMPVEGGMQ